MIDSPHLTAGIKLEALLQLPDYLVFKYGVPTQLGGLGDAHGYTNEPVRVRAGGRKWHVHILCVDHAKSRFWLQAYPENLGPEEMEAMQRASPHGLLDHIQGNCWDKMTGTFPPSRPRYVSDPGARNFLTRHVRR